MAELLDRKALQARHPGLRKGTIDWLVRTRRIPIVRIGGGKKIFFDAAVIDDWIRENAVPAQKGGKK